MFRSVALLAALAASLPLTASAAPAAQVITGAGAEVSYDCAGHSVVLQGDANVVRILGYCSRFVIRGSANDVHVTLVPGADVVIEGHDNVVRWEMHGPGRPVRVTLRGSRNEAHGPDSASPPPRDRLSAYRALLEEANRIPHNNENGGS